MKWIVAAIGICAIVFGAWWGWIGWSIVQVERGWSALIAGTVIGGAGLLMLGLAAVMARIDALIAVLRASHGGSGIETAGVTAAGLPVAPARRTAPASSAPKPPEAMPVDEHAGEAEPASAVLVAVAPVTAGKTDRLQPSSLPAKPGARATGAAPPGLPHVAMATGAAALATAATAQGFGHAQGKPPGAETGDDRQAPHAEPVAADVRPVSGLAVRADRSAGPAAVSTQQPSQPPAKETAVPETAAASAQPEAVPVDPSETDSREKTEAHRRGRDQQGEAVPPRRVFSQAIGWPAAPPLTVADDSAPNEAENTGDSPIAAEAAADEANTPRARLPRLPSLPDKATEPSRPAQPIEPDAVDSVAPPDAAAPQTVDAEESTWALPAEESAAAASVPAAPEPPALDNTVADSGNGKQGGQGSDDEWFGELLEARPSPERALAEPRNLARALNDLDAEPVADEPATGAPLPPASIAEQEPPRERILLRSYESQGIRYRLYVDGSIDAEGPGGALRFASLEELRAHIEKRRI